MNMIQKIRLIALTAAILAVSACVSAEKKLALAQEKDPQHQYDRAALCLQYNMVDESFKYLNQALALNPRFTPALNLRGLALMMKGRIPEAVTSLETCVQIDPAFSEAWNNLAAAYDQNNQKDKAVEAWGKAYAIDQNYNAGYNLAKNAYEKEQYDSALDWVQKAIIKFPKSVLSFNLQGLIYEAMERFNEAIDSYQQAMKIAPTELNVQFNLAMVYYKKKDYGKSREIFEKILHQAKNETLRSRVTEMLKRLGR
jgi:tetratricopeptide (TPR) repeat protein